MTVELPRNVRVGQVRRTVGIVSQAEWHGLSGDERAAADALALQVWWRLRQKQHPALEGTDAVFLTVRHVQRLLRAVGAAKTGEKAAAAAIRTMQAHGWIVDTGQVKRPRRPQASVDQAERFQPAGTVELEGGRDAQPTMRRSYWWRVFRVPAITQVIEALRPSGAYGHHGNTKRVPQRPASLSALLRRQGLIPRRRRTSKPRPGSVQWAFLQSGPP